MMLIKIIFKHSIEVKMITNCIRMPFFPLFPEKNADIIIRTQGAFHIIYVFFLDLLYLRCITNLKRGNLCLVSSLSCPKKPEKELLFFYLLGKILNQLAF